MFKSFFIGITLVLIFCGTAYGQASPTPVLDMAIDIGIDDDGGYYISDEVEGALQEIPAGDITFDELTITGDLTVTGGANLHYIDFDLTPSLTHQEGRVHWDEDDGTLNIGMPGGDVELQIGQEQLIRAKATENISNGDLVYVSGASGSRPEITKAQSNTLASAGSTIAMATEDIGINQNGYVTTTGLVRDVPVPTATYTEGDVLYLSSTTAGGFTNVAPVSPNYTVKIGYVLLAHNTKGTVLINIDQLASLYNSTHGITTGSIPFGDANGFLTEDNAGLFYNGNVGIGTTAPENTLHIKDTGVIPLAVEGSASGSLIRFEAGGSTKGYVGWTSLGDDGMAFLNSGGSVANMLITNDGNVGIGTDSPDAKFHVSSGNDSDVAVAGSTEGSVIFSNKNVNYGLQIGTQGTGHSWLQAQRNDGTTTLYNLFLQPLGGNVGIGTASPDANLEIASTGQPAIRLTDLDAANYYSEIRVQGNTLILQANEYPTGSGTLRFDVDGDVQGRITSGSLLMGDGSITVPRGKIDAATGQGLALVLGANVNATTRTDSTRKFARFGMVHYDLDEQDVALFVGDSNSTYTKLTFGGGTSGNNAATELNFNTATGINTLSGTTRMTIDTNGYTYFYKNVAVGGTDLDAMINANTGSGFALSVGADISATTRTDNTRKVGKIVYPHYDTDEEPATFAVLDSDGTDNIITLGGGSSNSNTATLLNFNTAPNTTSGTGTTRMSIDGDGDTTFSGDVGIGVAPTNSILHLYENTSNDGQLTIEQSGAGDSAIHFLFSASQEWTMGMDNTGNVFKISEDGALGTNDRLIIDIDGNTELSNDLFFSNGLDHDIYIEDQPASVDVDGEDGNTLNITGQNGGNSTDDVDPGYSGGAGGDIYILAGEGGTSESGDPGDGGEIYIDAGANGDASSAGTINIATQNGDGSVVIGTTTYITDGRIGNTSNNVTFAIDGELTLNGNARVVKCVVIRVAGFKAPGSNPADLVDLGIAQAYAFDANTQEYISTEVMLPKDIDRSVAPYLIADWSAAATTGTAVWQLEYLYRSEDEDMTAVAQETLSGTSSPSGTSNGLVREELTGIDLPSATDHGVLVRISRKTADANDDMSGDANLTAIKFCYTSNKLGEAL